jgi:hypothetical protein
MTHRLPVCTLPWSTLQVDDPSGLAACCCLDRARQPWGNVVEEGWPAVWNGSVAREHRRALLAGNTADFCHSDCPMLIEGGFSLLDRFRPRSDACRRNRAAIADDLRNGRVRSGAVPAQVNLTVNNRCNHDCIMCGQDSLDQRELPSKVYDGLQPWVEYIDLIGAAGGEVFLAENFRCFVARLGRVPRLQQPRFGFITNGTAPDERAGKLLAGLRLGYVVVSLHATTAATYRMIHRRRGLATAEAFASSWLKQASDDPEFVLLVAFTVNPENVQELAGFLRRWRKSEAGVLVIPVRGRTFDAAAQTVFGRRLREQLTDIKRDTTEAPGPVHGLATLDELCRRLESV